MNRLSPKQKRMVLERLRLAMSLVSCVLLGLVIGFAWTNHVGRAFISGGVFVLWILYCTWREGVIEKR